MFILPYCYNDFFSNLDSTLILVILWYLFLVVGSSSGRGGRFPQGRGGFRSESFRGHGNYGGGRSFGRSEYTNRGEFSGRGRSSGGRGGDGYHQGRGRSSLASGPKQNAGAAWNFALLIFLPVEVFLDWFAFLTI